MVTSTLKINQHILYDVWGKLHLAYFPTYKLNQYKLTWSNRRQKRTLASCNVRKKIVRVANELNYPEHQKWLAPLLYHEMCHAVMAEDLGNLNEIHKKIRWHGKDFKKLEMQHPKELEFKLWIKQGGWNKAIRSSRSKEWWKKVKNAFTL